jgi:putative transcriptional regulator
VYVVDDAPREAVDGTALIEREEMDSLEERDDLRELITDRTGENPA